MSIARILPASVSFIVAVSGRRFFAMIETENGLSLDTFGHGSSKDEAIEVATARYWNELYDHRDGSHLKGLVWVSKEGEKSKRIPVSQVPAYVADGYTPYSKGLTGKRKVASPVTVESATIN